MEIFVLGTTLSDGWTLEELDLSYNGITDLSSFPRLERGNLVKLKFDHNRISAVGDPATVFAMLHLSLMVELNIENNFMTTLPRFCSGTGYEAINETFELRNKNMFHL